MLLESVLLLLLLLLLEELVFDILPWVNSNRLGAIIGFIDPNQPIGEFKHVVTEGDNDKLCVVIGPLLDIVRNNGNITIIQCGIDFIHDIQWGWFEIVECKDKGKGGEGLFPTGKVLDLLPGFLGWAN